MDDEMLARVSKAILQTPNSSDYRRLVAINAIKAMREPTNAMLAAVPANWHSHRDIYARMICSVINE